MPLGCPAVMPTTQPTKSANPFSQKRCYGVIENTTEHVLHGEAVCQRPPGAIHLCKGDMHMFAEMDTYAFLAFTKAHQRDLQQQAEIDALWSRGVLRQQGKTHASRRRHTLLHILRHCRRAMSLGFQTLWQRRILVPRTWASGDFSQASRTIRG
jgi:hypothetical protein